MVGTPRKNAKRVGNGFEIVFSRMCSSVGVLVTRVPDGCRCVGKNKLIRVKTPFDWIISWYDRSALIDTKSTDKNYLQVSEIKEHQAAELQKHSLSLCSGYVVRFTGSKRVCFIPVARLIRSLHERVSIYSDDPEIKLLGDECTFDVRKIWPRDWAHTLPQNSKPL